MICSSCTDARSDPTRDYYSAHCVSCQARALAVTGNREALMTDPIGHEQGAVMLRLFGESWRDSLGTVRWWISRIRQREASERGAVA